MMSANLVPGGPDTWPEIQTAQPVVEGEPIDPRLQEMFDSARDRFKAEVNYTIPLDKQVLGNVEGYYLVDDSWFWIRRAVLLFLGLIGILFISRESLTEIPVAGKNPGWIMAALPYGLVVGLISPTLATPTTLGPIIGMTFFHVFAEQVFFIWFLGRTLIKAFSNPLAGAALTALLFGLYQISFCSTLALSGVDLFMGVLQVACFAGGAYVLLLFKSGGVLAPFIAHLVINVVMMISSVLALS